jgi:hypothetical protein
VAGTAALNLALTSNKASFFFNFGRIGANGGGASCYFGDLTFVNRMTVLPPLQRPSDSPSSADKRDLPYLSHESD